MLGMIGLLVGIALLMFFAFKGVKAIPLTLLATLVVILFNGLPVWDSFSTAYMAGWTNIVKSYFFVFVSSAIYAEFMNRSGCMAVISNQLIQWFGRKNVVLVCALTAAVLTYGGISTFVVLFAVGPIIFMLFQAANLPRHLTLCSIALGCATFTTYSLPGSTQLPNLAPTTYLGTTLTAAPVLSIVITAAIFVLGYAYCSYATKKAIASGETWSFPAGADVSQYQLAEGQAHPSPVQAFVPLLFVVLFVVGCSLFKAPIASDSVLLSVLAMTIGTLLCILLNWKFIKQPRLLSIRDFCGDGSENAVNSFIGLASVFAFGSVVALTPAYQSIVDWVMNVDIHPYFKGVLSTSVLSGISGSGTTGIRLTLDALSDYFVHSGCNLDTLHRLISVASGSLDTLPHNGAIFVFLGYTGLTHKEGYKHFFVITVLIPLAVVLAASAGCVLMGL